MLIIKTAQNKQPIVEGKKINQNGNIILCNGRYVRRMRYGNSLVFDSDWYDFFPIIGAIPANNGDTITFSVYSMKEGQACQPVFVNKSGFNQPQLSKPNASTCVYHITATCSTTPTTSSNCFLSYKITLDSGIEKTIYLFATPNFNNISQVKFTNFSSDYDYYFWMGNSNINNNDAVLEVLKNPTTYACCHLYDIGQTASSYSSTSEIMFSRLSADVSSTEHFLSGGALWRGDRTVYIKLMRWSRTSPTLGLICLNSFSLTNTEGRRLTINASTGALSSNDAAS